jgi:methionine aminotransferase
MQYALNDYLQHKDIYLYLPKFYEEKRNYFNQALASLPFTFTPAKGSYFQCVDYSNISDESDKDFAIRLTKEYGVAAVPVSAFYCRAIDNHKMLRFCFAKKKQTLDAAIEKLSRLK